MISRDVQSDISRLFLCARRARHELVTVEHLLWAMLDNPSAVEVLRACACNIGELRKTLSDLIVASTPTLAAGSTMDPRPAPEFDRAIERAVMYARARSGDAAEASGAHVLAAVFGERDSQVTYFLHQEGVTRLDVVSALARGLGRARRDETVAASDEAGDGFLGRAGEDPTRSRSPDDDIALTPDLKASLNACFMNAREARHEFVTVEHLLLALLDNPAAAEFLRGFACDIEALRGELRAFVDEHTPTRTKDSEADTLPTLGFQRVVQRAMLAAAPGTKFLTGRDLLVAIFGEVDSYAAYYLRQHGVTLQGSLG